MARATERAALHNVRVPNEDDGNRQARNKLLTAEADLRRQVEGVAALRRSLPTGGAVPEDCLFEEGGMELSDDRTVRQVRLSELFGDKPMLLAYSFMHGPKMQQPCPMCTSMLDSLNGNARHITQRASLAVIARSPIGRI